MEREADRIGFAVLGEAGFSPQGFVDMFAVLQQSGRLADGGAFPYLRSHPLTTTRISDMQNRMQNLQYKQVPDSLEFQLMRAKLRATQDTPAESVKFFEESLKERKYLSEVASRFGLVEALARARDYVRAARELKILRAALPPHPAIESLSARLLAATGDITGSLRAYREALRNFPGYRALIYNYAESLLRINQPQEALKLIDSRLSNAVADYKLYQLQARAYAALNKGMQQHRALAEANYRLGNIRAAIEQLLLAQRAGDGDFYLQSSVDARLRELRALDNDSRKDGRK